MTRFMALGLTLSGLVFLCLAIAFLLEQPWATALWPWMTYRLSKVFIASILAAIAAPILWIGLSREFAAITGGAVNLFVTFSGMAAYSFVAVAENSARRGILAFGVVCAAAALISLAMAFWAGRLSFKDSRRLPMPVKISFGAFAVILMITGLALVRAQPNIFPWILSRDLSVLYGWIFLGAACYFLYGFLVPVWGNAQGQLIGFLAYDAVLIAPFVHHFGTVAPEMRLSLIVYTAVIVYSGLLALYYLFVHRGTRCSLVPNRGPMPRRVEYRSRQ